MDALKDRVLELGPKAVIGAYKNFSLTRDEDGIAWLLFDRAGASANTLSADLLRARRDRLGAESQRPTGLVVRSQRAVSSPAPTSMNSRRQRSRCGQTQIGRACGDRLGFARAVVMIHGFASAAVEVALAADADRDRRCAVHSPR